MAAEETPIEVCGHRAHPKFRSKAEGKLTDCVQPPEHNGNHIYCMRVSAGVDERSHALHYHEEIQRSTLKPIMVVDMKGHELTPPEECAALWQFLELVKQSGKRRKKKGND